MNFIIAILYSIESYSLQPVADQWNEKTQEFCIIIQQKSGYQRSV